MKYIVYLTTNKINNKIYIGVHETENPDIFDGYLGCGANINKPSSYNKGKTHLHNAILKYGTSAFYRQTIKEFDNLEDALNLEFELVTEEFIKRTDTYNMTIGGGMPPKFNKIIYQFDLNGNLIKEWDSIKSIINKYKCNHDRIWMCIRDKRTFNNYYWSSKNKIDVNEYKLSARGCVYQYNKDGVLLNKFENASQAALKLDLTRESISNAVYNRTTCNGYYFLKPDEDIYELLNSKSNKINLSKISIYRYTESGDFDCEFSCIQEAVNSGISRRTLKSAIENNKIAKGYRWSYEKSDKIKIHTPLKPVKIAQYDLNHNLIKIWDSVKDCKKEFPSCQKVCRKERKSTNGFIFEYIS